MNMSACTLFNEQDKGSNLLSIIISSVLGKQSVQSKKVYCAKRSKLTIFSLEPQGHVISHALKREKMITWIPTTRQVENLSFYSLNL